MHGHGIIKEVKSLSEARVQLPPGTLCGALDRLKNDGLVEVTGEERFEDRLRRYYRLTDAGIAALRQEIDRQERVAQIARSGPQARPSSPVGSLGARPLAAGLPGPRTLEAS